MKKNKEKSKKNITPRQENFCREYVIDFKGSQAAIRAGYSKKTAKEQASRLLTKANIQEFVAKLKKEKNKRQILSADEVLAKVCKIASDKLENYMSFETKKVIDKKLSKQFNKEIAFSETVINVKDSKDIDTWNIKKVKKGRDGQFEFELHCKDSALKLLMEHYGLLKSSVTIEDIEINFNKKSPSDFIKEKMNNVKES